MEFYWFGLLFWLLVGVSCLLLIIGLRKVSWKALFISGIFLLIPSLYFIGAENWLKIVVVLPLIPFLFAYRMKKRI
ncbi:hypothetical protein [Niallia sp.]|uniref:hypothetical protein n=1 Tax=Niallia sp. TaxID=2837523 RepID=UPI00289C0C84|nr:hypothetical protein [Niallia sp.]